MYLFGELTNFSADTAARMSFNVERGAYEKRMFLKQGFYNYSYMALPSNGKPAFPDFGTTEGNYWGTENSYIVLVYFRPFGGRAYQLIGFTSLSSIFQRSGL